MSAEDVHMHDLAHADHADADDDVPMNDDHDPDWVSDDDGRADDDMPGLEPIDLPSRRRGRASEDGDQDRDRRHPATRAAARDVATASAPSPDGSISSWSDEDSVLPFPFPPSPNVIPEDITQVLPSPRHRPPALNPPSGLPSAPSPPPTAPSPLADLFASIMRGIALRAPTPEKDDPAKAKRIIDALEDVPVGLVRRLERASPEGNGCAICWDKLLDGDGAQWGDSGREDASAPATQDRPRPTLPEVDPSISSQVSTSSEASHPEASQPTPSSSDPPAPASPSAARPTGPPRIVALPCAHVFHAPCLVPWFSRPRRTTCPTCRFDLDPDGTLWIGESMTARLDGPWGRPWGGPLGDDAEPDPLGDGAERDALGDGPEPDPQGDEEEEEEAPRWIPGPDGEITWGVPPRRSRGGVSLGGGGIPLGVGGGGIPLGGFTIPIPGGAIPVAGGAIPLGGFAVPVGGADDEGAFDPAGGGAGVHGALDARGGASSGDDGGANAGANGGANTNSGHATNNNNAAGATGVNNANTDPLSRVLQGMLHGPLAEVLGQRVAAMHGMAGAAEGPGNAGATEGAGNATNNAADTAPHGADTGAPAAHAAATPAAQQPFRDVVEGMLGAIFGAASRGGQQGAGQAGQEGVGQQGQEGAGQQGHQGGNAGNAQGPHAPPTAGTNGPAGAANAHLQTGAANMPFTIPFGNGAFSIGFDMFLHPMGGAHGGHEGHGGHDEDHPAPDGDHPAHASDDAHSDHHADQSAPDDPHDLPFTPMLPGLEGTGYHYHPTADGRGVTLVGPGGEDTGMDFFLEGGAGEGMPTIPLAAFAVPAPGAAAPQGAAPQPSEAQQPAPQQPAPQPSAAQPRSPATQHQQQRPPRRATPEQPRAQEPRVDPMQHLQDAIRTGLYAALGQALGDPEAGRRLADEARARDRAQAAPANAQARANTGAAAQANAQAPGPAPAQANAPQAFPFRLPGMEGVALPIGGAVSMAGLAGAMPGLAGLDLGAGVGRPPWLAAGLFGGAGNAPQGSAGDAAANNAPPTNNAPSTDTTAPTADAGLAPSTSNPTAAQDAPRVLDTFTTTATARILFPPGGGPPQVVLENMTPPERTSGPPGAGPAADGNTARPSGRRTAPRMGTGGRRWRRLAWTLPPAPGPTVREVVERREREAGLRCSDHSCGVGPSDEDPLVEVGDAERRQIRIARAGGGAACAHLLHAPCLVSAQRVALRGAPETVADGRVEVACPVCRVEGTVALEDWPEGVRRLEAV